MADLSRSDQLAMVKRKLQATFPAAEFSTNADANPATPMTVRVSWGNGRITKTVRADAPSDTIEKFLGKAVPFLERFQNENVPSKHLEEQASE